MWLFNMKTKWQQFITNNNYSILIFFLSAMKLFQLIEKPFDILGIYPPKHPDESPLTIRRFITLLILLQFSILALIFFLFEAATFREYADSFYVSATAMLKVCNYTVILCKLTKIFGLIQRFELVIHTRELDSLT